jgi:hypothetical protein
MAQRFILLGGLLNLIFAALHVGLAVEIARMPGVSGHARGILHAVNVGLTICILFFAYVSLRHRQELLETRLGRAILLVIALVYLARAAEEVLLFSFDLSLFVASLLVGGLYAFLFALSIKQESPAAPA